MKEEKSMSFKKKNCMGTFNYSTYVNILSNGFYDINEMIGT